MERAAAGGPRAVWLVRHASRRDFDEPGWAATAARPEDPPLSESGRREAWRIGRRLAAEPVAHVFASPFLRAVETGCAVAEALELPLKVEAGLSEWLSADWFPAPPRLLPLASLLGHCRRIDADYRPSGDARHGESGIEALRRAGRTALALARGFPGDLVLVGHGASVLGAAAGLLGVTPEAADRRAPLPEMPPGCISRLVASGAGFVLEVACDTSHLVAPPRAPEASG